MMITSSPAKTKQRRKELDAFYDAYYSDNGRCRFYEMCAEEQGEKGFRFSRVAAVGDNFDLCVDGRDTRIVFVGKEGRWNADSVGLTARLSDFRGEKRGVNQHYRETYKMLCEMLCYNWEDGRIKDGRRYLDKPDADLCCYALTNLYRCAFKENDADVQHIRNSWEQTKNCLELLCKELQILEPTVLVLQKADLRAVRLFPDAVLCADCETVWYSKQAHTYVIETSHPNNPNKNKGWYNYYKPRFTDAVNYLSSIGALPARGTDLTVEIDDLLPAGGSEG